MKNIEELKAASTALAQKEEKGGEGYLVEIKQIPGTPFSAVKREDKKSWFIIWGSTVILPEIESYEKCLQIAPPFGVEFYNMIATYAIAANQIYQKGND